MSDEKRCDCCQRYWYYDDLVSGLCPNCLDFLATKNLMDIEQDQKIKELEHRLSNCIEPKFKVGQELYIIDEYDYSVVPFEIDKILIDEDGIKIKSVEWEEWFEEDEVFITREEAEAKAKLEEMKNG